MQINIKAGVLNLFLKTSKNEKTREKRAFDKEAIDKYTFDIFVK